MRGWNVWADNFDLTIGFIGFIWVLHPFQCLFWSRLRNYHFYAKIRGDQYKCDTHTYHSTRNWTLSPNIKFKFFPSTHFGKSISKICVGESPKILMMMTQFFLHGSTSRCRYQNYAIRILPVFSLFIDSAVQLVRVCSQQTLMKDNCWDESV